MISLEEVINIFNVSGFHELWRVELQLWLILFEFLPKAILLQLGLLCESPQKIRLL